MTSAEIIRGLVEANLAGGAAVAAVVLLRRPARRLIGAGAAYGLWLAVPLAAAATLAPSPRLQVVEMTAPAFEVVVEAPAVSKAVVAAPMDIALGLALLWAAGALVFALALMISQRRFVRSLGPIRREGMLARAAVAAGPAVVGALRPRIVAPADFEARFDALEREVILDHEKIHLASGHAQINALVALVQCVCWFNPLAHLAAQLMRIDQELACDAAVIARHPGRRRVYAEALLKTQTTARPLPFGCYWPAGGAGPLKVRIAMLKMPTPAKARRLMGAGVVLGLGLVGAAAAWAAQPPRVNATDAQSPKVAAPTPAPEIAEEPAEDRRELPATVNLTNADPDAEAPPAPPERPTLITRPQWGRVPSPDEMAEHWPDLAPGESGSGMMSCTVSPAGRLSDCSVDSEIPAGHGIADSLLGLSELFEMNPETDGGESVGGARLRVPVRFQALDEAAELTPPADLVPGDSVLLDPAARRALVLGTGAAARLRPTSAPQPAPPVRPSVITRPTWLAQPTSADLSLAYPSRAMRMERQGMAVMTCTVTGAGGLTACAVASESPVGLEFGQAALSLAGKFRMSPTTEDGRSVAGARVNVPVQFRLGPPNA